MTERDDGQTRIAEHVTCLGCGCACDDITVVVDGGRITEARRACALGVQWFGDGSVPAQVLARGTPVALDAALDEAARVLRGARRVLVFLAPDVSCETQRTAVAIADRLRGLLDSVTSRAAAGVLAAQRRGRAGATLGEVRNRTDLLVFWGVDPTNRYPRFTTRYAPDPAGLFVPAGRRSRTVLAVDIGDATGTQRGPSDADARVALTAIEELDVIALARAAIAGRPVPTSEPLATRANDLATRLSRAAYATIVSDAEPGAGASPARAEALIALTQSLNAVTRAAHIALRGGGNRNGADAVMTWQTGFPMAVDFARGFPRYVPDEGATAWLARGAADAVLLVGRALDVDARQLGGIALVAIGPWASGLAGGRNAAVAIDTGVAGIHEGGTAYRMDDVPLPLGAPLPGPLDTARTLEALADRLGARARTR